MTIRAAILCALLILPAAARGQSPAPRGEALTLDEAITLALRHNRLLQNEELEVAKAADRLAAARTLRRPSFDFSLLQLQLLTPVDFRFDRGAFGSFPSTGPVPSRETRVSAPRGPITYLSARATQPLSQLHRIGLGLRSLEAGREIAEGRLVARRQAVVNGVKRAYYAALQAQGALAASAEALRLYRELDRVVGQYVVQQVALEAERLDVRTRLAKEEYEALALANALATHKEQLNDLLGRDLRTEFEVVPMAGGALYETDLAAAQSRALAQRPEVEEARLRLKQADYDRRIKQSQLIPDVSLTFGYFSPFGLAVVPKNVAAVGLSVSWEPFDWGRRRREAAEKLKASAQAANAAREAESAVLLEVNARFRKLQESRALLGVARLAQQAAGERLRVATNKYAQEAALLKDVLQEQAAAAEANDRYQQALAAFWTARADFEKALGES